MGIINLALPFWCSMSIHGYTLQRALDEFHHVPRTLDVLELWSGVGSIARAAEAAGFASQAMDKMRIPGTTDSSTSAFSEDFECLHGFRNGLKAIMSLRERGLAWMAPECRSFVFMNSVRCKRSKSNPQGDGFYEPVRSGNLQAAVLIFYFALCLLRDVFPVGEQPSGSIMFRLPIVASFIRELKPHLSFTMMARCAFDTQPVGQRFLKKFKVWGQHWIHLLSTVCQCGTNKHEPLVLVRSKGKKKAITGKKVALKISGSYPLPMGDFVVKHWSHLTALDNIDTDMDQFKKDPTRKVKKLKRGKANKAKAPKKRLGLRAPKAKAPKQKPQCSASSSWKCFSEHSKAQTASKLHNQPASSSSWKRFAGPVEEPKASTCTLSWKVFST